MDSPVCDRCNSAPESIIHVVIDCPNSVIIWSHSSAVTLIKDAPRSSLLDFLIWVHGHFTDDSFFLSCCIIMWAAWFLRNKEIFSDERCDPVGLTSKFHDLVHDFNSYEVKVFVPPHDSLLRFKSWHSPLGAWVKINFNANVSVGNCRGLGVVFRDSGGKLLMAGVHRVNSLWSLEVCEAAAALYGMELAVRFGYHIVHLEGDSMNVVRSIDQRVEGHSPIHFFYDQLCFFVSKTDGFCCNFVARKGNSLAHTIVRWDTGLACEKVCMKPFSQELLTLAFLDL